ncbi:MAG TPA: CoA-binding protein [Solirubrobacteraceae bacterium]|jgi:succinyl-CoA synthetase alpha subunit|nr:CoA-binding protein [Solirubrobacteraceae bacterium]
MSVLVGAGTRLLVQGITGREAANFTRECLDYGTQVVAGVTPGKGGEEVYRVPVFDTVEEAAAATHPDAALISVPPLGVLDAALEAIDARIPLLVIITERVPRRDVAALLTVAHAAGTTVVGPNSLGLIAPGACKLGSIGGPAADVRRAYTPGRVGVVSRSGGMTTEIASMLTRAGIGQSTCISVGGDSLIGTTLLDAYRLFAEDPDTEAVVTFSEPGGAQEHELAEFLEASGGPPTPLFCFVAGRFVDDMPGTRFGHAGTMVEAGGSTARAKIARLRAAGAHVADRLDELPVVVTAAMGTDVAA